MGEVILILRDFSLTALVLFYLFVFYLLTLSKNIFMICLF